jgi:butyryl-CoA dehydrogenase
MWISAGEHELAENIIHLVLAKIDGAPAGTSGISLFIVPRSHLNADGTTGARNGIALAGLNHKMGNRATVNTALNLGESEPCVGELVGQPGRGLAAMFHMMNEARLAIGVVSCGLGMAGYLYAAEYARDRTQGRALTERDPATPPIPIIEHPDVRRMLLQQRAWIEGSLALCLYCARLVDEEAVATDPADKKAAHALLDLLTPIAKAYPSDHCTRANDLAIQVLGGYGYSREYPVERLWRDNRLNAIHEGTNGIQGLDLLGRKVLKDGGRSLGLLATRIIATITAARADERLHPLSSKLAHALTRAQSATAAAAQQAASGDMNLALSQSTAYLELCGHVVVGWMWLRQGLVASAALARPNLPEQETNFYLGKLAACQTFFLYDLPKVDPLAALIESADPLLTSIHSDII